MAPHADAPGPHKNLIGHRIADGRLELVSVLGLGAYGVVYLARDLHHPAHHNKPFASSSSASSFPRSLAAAGGGSAATGFYAVKSLSKQGLDARQRSFQRREIMLHTIASNHPSVVTLHRVIDAPEDPCVYVILDYCPDGDLFSMITEHQRYLVPPPETYDQLEEAAIEAARAAKVDADLYLAKHRDTLKSRAMQSKAQYLAERAAMDTLIKSVFCQILDAVEFCHSYGIYHRDLKPENILCLQGGNKVVLADFGLATGEKSSSDFGCGSTFYMGPECQGGITSRLTEYNTAANDVWSLGVILVNLICGRNPWKQACTADETFREYLRRPDFLMDILPISEEANSILKRIFTVRADWRISTRDLRKLIHQVRHFTVTDDEMKAREHRSRIAIAQAKTAHKSAASGRSLADRYQEQLQQQQAQEAREARQLQQEAEERFFARQHHAHGRGQSRRHDVMAAAAGQERSPQQYHNVLYAEAYGDDDAGVQAAAEDSDDEVYYEDEDDEGDLEADEDEDDDAAWSGDSDERSSSSRNWIHARQHQQHHYSSYSSGSTGASSSSSSSSIPTSPESVTSVSVAPSSRKSCGSPLRMAGQQLQHHQQQQVQPSSYEEGHLSSGSVSGESASSRRSSFSYTGLPPTPRFVTQATFLDAQAEQQQQQRSAGGGEMDQDVHHRLKALAIRAGGVAKKRAAAVVTGAATGTKTSAASPASPRANGNDRLQHARDICG